MIALLFKSVGKDAATILAGMYWCFERKLVIIIKELIDILYHKPQRNLCSCI